MEYLDDDQSWADKPNIISDFVDEFLDVTDGLEDADAADLDCAIAGAKARLAARYRGLGIVWDNRNVPSLYTSDGRAHGRISGLAKGAIRDHAIAGHCDADQERPSGRLCGHHFYVPQGHGAGNGWSPWITQIPILTLASGPAVLRSLAGLPRGLRRHTS